MVFILTAVKRINHLTLKNGEEIMKVFRRVIITLMILLLAAMSGFSQTDKKGVKYLEGSYKANWQSLAKHETPDWYKDAVLGIYFHWGIYSVPAFGCWGGRNMYLPNGGNSEDWGHIEDKYKNTYDYVKQVYGKPGTEFGYKDFIPMFNAEKWEPDVWAALFRESGADFAGPVAIHHDGFAMWDSEFAEYNSMDKGPKLDITGEMLEAVRKYGMKTFVSFHQYTNWFFFNPGRKICPPGVDVNNHEFAGLYGPVREYKGDWQKYPFSEAFQQAWYNKVKEVIDKYRPDQIWYEIGFSDEDCVGPNYVKAIMAHYFNSAEQWGGEVVVTRKDDDLPLSCSVLNLEAHSEDEAQEVIWQTDIALGTNHAWAYSPDAVSRPANVVIDEIVDRKSKNGVTLLSLAPLPDGTLPPSQVIVLKQMEWMAVNKEALSATRPAPFVEGGSDLRKSGTIRFTEKELYCYAIELGNKWDKEDVSGNDTQSTPPSVPFMIPGVTPIKDSKITLLGSEMSLPWHQEGENVVIKALPNPLPGEYAWSFKIQVR
jgi:alpha-L-fucosidase